MSPLISRSISIFLAVVTVGFAMPASGADFSPLQSRERVFSSLGFSFLPPQGTNWREQFGENVITYLKVTNPEQVSFYCSAIEGNLRSALAGRDALIAFVRAKKDQWGNDGRFTDRSSSFKIDVKNSSCVRYSLLAHDQKANNKGNHKFLLVETNGCFCQHPQDKTAGVDIYYSVRYVSEFDPKELIVEGEAFLQSLQFSKKK